jgi:hypothetical protein
MRGGGCAAAEGVRGVTEPPRGWTLCDFRGVVDMYVWYNFDAANHEVTANYIGANVLTHTVAQRNVKSPCAVQKSKV